MSLQEGKIFRITCVADGSVLDLTAHNANNGVQIITCEFNGGNNQKWVARKTSRGWYLGTLAQGKNSMVLDQDVGGANLIIWEWHTGSNQEWNLQPVSPGSHVFTIVNVCNNKAITSHGRGNKVTCDRQDITSAWQHWIVQQV